MTCPGFCQGRHKALADSCRVVPRSGKKQSLGDKGFDFALSEFDGETAQALLAPGAM